MFINLKTLEDKEKAGDGRSGPGLGFRKPVREFYAPIFTRASKCISLRFLWLTRRTDRPGISFGEPRESTPDEEEYNVNRSDHNR